MSEHIDCGCAEQAADGPPQAQMEAGQAAGGAAMAQGQAGGPQAAEGQQGCSCGCEEQVPESGGQAGPAGPPPQGWYQPGMMGYAPPQGMAQPGMMGYAPPQGVPQPGMMGYAPPQGMPHPGMMGYAPPQGMPHPGMMGGPPPGKGPSGCDCHDNPGAGMPQAGPMAGQVPPGNQFGQMFGFDPQMQPNGQFGQMFGMVSDVMNGKADPSALAGLLDTSDSRFWKGLLVGAAMTFLLTNTGVKDALGGMVGGLFGANKEQPEE